MKKKYYVTMAKKKAGVTLFRLDKVAFKDKKHY